MKAAKWILKDNDAGLVTVLCDDIANAEETTIHESGNLKFSILRHTINSKRIGYKLEYNNKSWSAKKALFNSFMLMYSKEKEFKKENMGLEVVYYDPVVRLFKFQHKEKNSTDYMLIGRWRSPNEELVEEVEDAE